MIVPNPIQKNRNSPRKASIRNKRGPDSNPSQPTSSGSRARIEDALPDARTIAMFSAPTFSAPFILPNSSKTHLKLIADKLGLTPENHQLALQICGATRPEDQFVTSIGFLSYLKQKSDEPTQTHTKGSDWAPTSELKDAIRPELNALIMDLGIVSYSRTVDLNQRLISNSFDQACVYQLFYPFQIHLQSKDRSFIKFHYPPGYETEEGNEAHKAMLAFYKTQAVATRSRLRGVLLTNVLPINSQMSKRPMPGLAQLMALICRGLINTHDTRSETEIFDTSPKSFRQRVAFLRVHAVASHRNPSSNGRRFLWDYIDEALLSLKEKHAGRDRSMYKKALLGPDPDRVMEQYNILEAEKNAEAAHETEEAHETEAGS
ncbi:uncharacterized protein MELLADRAFT_96295 [Melampsora larici-populina 98AG31]|uniref:Uncharacterized protein n=1 Tax=Melampsora larici-populina (strain 98AG31 / pathotype 3-4-7) TaxID=747676 RepID=F4RE95_MELLP|nr:uncharacterized protein MELLADRAFT_96295 [Melampsora larici-populina 98AG31]EGG09052.1 hypothetical protein MELLADRAFT_96295 [Melampsora larici-populina 98AG31]